MTKKKAPPHLRAFMLALGILCVVLGILLMIAFPSVTWRGLPKEYLEELRRGYLFAVTAYGGGAVAEAKLFEVRPDRRHLPFEFILILWGALFAWYTVRILLDHTVVNLALYGELSFVFSWVFAVFMAVRAGKDLPDNWLKN